jgi:endoglucanase
MDLLQKLIQISGTSGDEKPVREVVHKEIRRYVDGVSVDRLGNLIAKQRGEPPKVMLAAHMDEVGLMVKRIDPRGFIYCSEIGGIDAMGVVGQKVHINTKKGRINGVVTFKELSAGKSVRKCPSIEDVFIDTGLSKAELKGRGIVIGSYIHMDQRPHYLGTRDFISGKALDDRIGCYILIELARKLKKTKYEVYFVFTVQEEVGLYGARTSAFQIEPDWGIAVDVTHANDVFEDPTRCLGKGPCITVKDGELIANRCINEWLIDIAKRKRIPYQLEASEIGTTDATNILVSRRGVPASVLSVPVRNIHTTISIANRKDIENAIKLLAELLKKPPKKCF